MCMLILMVVTLLRHSVVDSAALTYISERSNLKTVTSEINNPTVSGHHRVDTKVHLFVTDGNNKPYSYVNDFGELIGFDREIVNRVCVLAGKRCHTVLAESSECIFTDMGLDYAGRGLMSGWFHGCLGYQITTDRQNEFDFSLPYLDSGATFAVAPGNPAGFNPDVEDYSLFTIAHMNAAATNSVCLRRLHKKFGKVLMARDLQEATSWLLNRTADALFSPKDEIEGLEVLPQKLRCDKGGAGIMLNKGSDVSTWWNPAFQKLYFSGEYSKLCQESSVKFGGKIQCLPSPNKMSPGLVKLLTADTKPVPEKLWKFVVSGRIRPYSFLNDEGELIGFTKNMLDTGLMEEWFDACTGYFNTQDRENSWDFTSPYLLSNASFYVLQGNPTGFNPDSEDYSSFSIVYQDTAITNSHCLNRLHKKFNKLISVLNKQEAINMVLNKSADTWFTKELGITELQQLPQRFHCEHVGTSIMTKKGSELPTWWNVAFNEFYSTGGFNNFCQEQGRMFNFTFPCVQAAQVSSMPRIQSQEGLS